LLFAGTHELEEIFTPYGQETHLRFQGRGVYRTEGSCRFPLIVVVHASASEADPARLGLIGSFSDGSYSGLTEVLTLALMHIEALLNIVLGRFDRHQAGGELHVAVLADAEQGMVTHEFKFSLCHD